MERNLNDQNILAGSEFRLLGVNSDTDSKVLSLRFMS